MSERKNDMNEEIIRAKIEMESHKRLGNLFGYKQAKRHYERLLRKERAHGYHD